ncbi:Ig-like domain-containing protein [Sodaliphilus sp.]|uniref:Ig-like domain-containing protein n=1 Tax=Sodaliphilus sp. TaxID=2815818 RepID=UPI00388FD35C
MCVIGAQYEHAQIIKGDMNHDGKLDVIDVNAAISTIEGMRDIEYIKGGPYSVDNSSILGTWYRNKSESFTLNEDGTTDYPGAVTYMFFPYQGRIVFFDKYFRVVSWLGVIRNKDGYMRCVTSGSNDAISYNAIPKQYVEQIKLSTDHVILQHKVNTQLTAECLPSDASNKNVIWSSSDESVAVVNANGYIYNMGAGSAVITCTSVDDNCVKATCTVEVAHEDRSGVDSNGHRWVDLDLPGGVLWAECNIGASKPGDSGLYFAWADTKGYTASNHNFSLPNYKYFSESKGYTKYCSVDYHGVVDNKTIIESSDDAATAAWGSGWRMPSRQEFSDLLDGRYTTNYYDRENNCYRVVSRLNGNTLTLAANGWIEHETRYYYNEYAKYWTNELSDGYSSAYFMSHSYTQIHIDFTSRYFGYGVRAVRTVSAGN